MTFLYEKLDSAREWDRIKPVPGYVLDNLNPKMPIRPYQKEALENFITYFENPRLRNKPSQTLFHMATGSGKTYIMAALVIYLYKQGYRNFIFFVNLGNIVEKTKLNFLDAASSKYLFSNDIVINGEHVKINEVSNFQGVDDKSINICFSTIQGLHADMWTAKENAMTYDDFESQKVVLISDEAHHINADTKKLNKEEAENYHSWEETVKRIFHASPDNVMLEFTATCDLQNPLIRNEYESKIIYDYPLRKFRKDIYSKEIISLRTDLTIMQRALQGIILSQYRLKIFKDNRLDIKPVILFKASKIEESKQRMAEFIEMIRNLSAHHIEAVAELNNDELMAKAYKYFSSNGFSYDMLVAELKEAFSEEHCVSVNDNAEAEQKQLLLNSLEDKDNPYRAIFEVKKLDEGWDVLNLFDIVRLYETRQSGGKTISKTTVAEAQLIGRGARYCPFSVDDQNKYKRKYDADLNNPLRICETLVYHCQNDSRYIAELHQALREIGVEPEMLKRRYVLKDSFKNSSVYKSFMYVNRRVEVSRNNVYELQPSVRNTVYSLRAETGESGENIILEDDNTTSDAKVELYLYETSIRQIATINYAIVNKDLGMYPALKFNILHKYFPHLETTREFITSEKYLGSIKINIKSRFSEPPLRLLTLAVHKVLNAVADTLAKTEISYMGTKDFHAVPVEKIFKDKEVGFEREVSGGQGVSQNDPSVANDIRMDLSRMDWYAFNDNYSTSEEKALVAFIKDYMEKINEKYAKAYLVRNERHFPIYSFEAGERFEPDFVLFLQKGEKDSIEQMQIFIEPKGEQLLAGDKWKEDFLLQIKQEASVVKALVDDRKYTVWGLHFFNREKRDSEFRDDFKELL